MTGAGARKTPQPEGDDERAARDDERAARDDAEAGEPIKATPTANPARVRVPPEGPRSDSDDDPFSPGRPGAEEA
ncbi:hypothetical protein [Micromonospora sp. DT233]|uniref:hypothetical protein n=1 Tax=Micromonospora sp. DT233 TaxID=3393432 RepID=UPI003CEE21CA